MLLLFTPCVQNVGDGLPEMRAISCWVLSRYCPLYADLPQQQQSSGGGSSNSNGSSTAVVVPGGGQEMYLQTLHALLQAMFDTQPKVQIAACSALSVLIEHCYYIPTTNTTSTTTTQENILTSQLYTILGAINRAFDLYGVKSSLILIDTIGTIADAVGAELKSAQYTALYLPKLMQRFESLEDTGITIAILCCIY